MKLARRLRSVVAIGLVWGFLWAVLAMIAGTIIGAIDPSDIDRGEEPIVLAPLIGLVGLVCGVVFGVLLFTAARGRGLLDLSVMRIGMWGIVVAAALILVTGKGLPELAVAIPVGALSAMASVAFMRMWPAATVTQ